MTRKSPAMAVAISSVLILGVLLYAQDKPLTAPVPPGSNGVGYPSCLSCPDAQYSEEALKARFQGTISLTAVIEVDGHATNIEVLTKRGLGLDEEAIAAVKKWRFKPALGPDGKAVATMAHIVVTFHLPQEASAHDCHSSGTAATDPVSSRLRQVFDCYSDGLIAQSEGFPVNKYSGQRILGATVGHNIAHVAFINDFACSKIAGIAAPRRVALANEFGDVRVESEEHKGKLVTWLKSSIDFCRQAFSKLSDAKLGEGVPWNGFTPGSTGNPGERVTRFAAALWVNDVLIERYGAFAGYLQAGGSLSAIDSVPRLPRVTQ
jgi:TonB family protein